MNVFVVYCHPGRNSFTESVKESFLKGIEDSGNTYEVSDLYRMNFDPIFSAKEYDREAYYESDIEVLADVLEEQRKINRADKIAFIYPVFWTEAPAMLTGWFQRVWTYGFAYGENRQMKKLEEAVFLVTMGGSTKDEIRQEQIAAMKTVMIGDRIHDRAKSSNMVIFDEMTRGYGNEENREERIKRFTKQAYQIGCHL